MWFSLCLFHADILIAYNLLVHLPQISRIFWIGVNLSYIAQRQTLMILWNSVTEEKIDYQILFLYIPYKVECDGRLASEDCVFPNTLQRASVYILTPGWVCGNAWEGHLLIGLTLLLLLESLFGMQVSNLIRAHALLYSSLLWPRSLPSVHSYGLWYVTRSRK